MNNAVVDDGSRTLADIRTAANRLRQACDWVNLMQQGGHVDGLIRPGSTAASDASLRGYRPLIEDVLSFAGLQIAAALDHADALAKWGTAAAQTEPTPVWAVWSVARSLVEVCAGALWLTEVPLSTRRRAARMLSISKRDSLSMIAIGQDESQRVAEADASAATLRLREVKTRRGRFLGFEQAIPSYSDQVRSLLPDLRDFRAYSMLSAASHGEPWAIMVMGYEVDDRHPSTGPIIATKRPPALWLWTALTLARMALANGSRSVAEYAGWPLPSTSSPKNEPQ